MKKLIVLFCAVVVLGLSGCSLWNARSMQDLLEDPHYREYLQKQEDLEKQYLEEQITYSDYLKQKKEMDNMYEYEVKERNKKLQDQK